MMTPRERTMPTIEARWQPRRGWAIVLPDGREFTHPSVYTIERLVRRNAPGTAIRFVGRDDARLERPQTAGEA